MPRASADARLPRGTSRLPARNLRNEGLQRLVGNYATHQFVIDWDEARDGLFKNVAPPEPAEQLLVDALGELACHPLDEVRLLRYTRRERRKKEETVDIKIRKRMKAIRAIEIENMKKYSKYRSSRRETMRGIRRTRPKKERRPNGPGSRESIEAFLKAAFG